MGTWVLLIGAVLLMGYAVYELVARPASARQHTRHTAAPTARSGAVSVARAPIALSARLDDLRAIPMAATANATTLIVAMSVLGVVGWLVLCGWYSLFGHYTRPDFAFDKIPDHYNSSILQNTTWIFLALTLMYGAIFALLRTVPQVSRALKATIILGVVGAAVVNVFIYPVGALDAYYYIIELKLAYLYHLNPYITTMAQTHPIDALATSGFAFGLDLLFPYGPAWLLLSWAPTVFTGFADVQHVLIGLKLYNMLQLAITAYLLYRYQDDDRRGWLAAYLFLANPLVLFEGVGNAHNDVMMAMFLVAALLALKKQSWLAGPLLMLSVLVKFFSAGLVPLFLLVMLKQRWSVRKIAMSALSSMVVLFICCAPYWAGGRLIGGFEAATTASQGASSASIFSLLREYMSLNNAFPTTISALHSAMYGVFAVLAIAILFGVGRGRDPEPAANDTFLLFSVLLSLLYPWYLITAFALLALRRGRIALGYLYAATTFGLVYHPLSVWAWFNSGWIPFHIHLLQGLFLAAPILGLFLVELGLYAAARSRWLRRIAM